MMEEFDARRGKVLLTGASGHLGANLLRRLLSDGHQVRTLLRPNSDNSAVEGLQVEKVWGDLRDRQAVDAATAGCRFVFHTAAKVSTAEGVDRDRREIFASNVLATRNVLSAARQANVARVVVTGSLSGTGYDLDDPSKAVGEDQPYFPFHQPMPYEATKMLVEHECLRAYAEGLDVVVATSCAILGPNDYKPSRMGRVLCDFSKGKLRAYIPGGFEFVTARDIVAGHVLAMQRGRAGQKYIFSSQFLTVDELMALMEDVTGRKRPRVRLPAPLMGAIAQLTHGLQSRLFPDKPQRFTPGAVRILQMHRHADVSKAKNELGYTPTPVVEALQEAHQDFIRRGIIAPPTVQSSRRGRQSRQLHSASEVGGADRTATAAQRSTTSQGAAPAAGAQAASAQARSAN